MWLEITYRPTSLFSLRKSESTNTAAKSLLAPSPYSIKMALLNSVITFNSLTSAINNFELIKELEIQYALSNYICVNNCFVKIQKEPHSDKKKKNPDLAFDSTVGFREYVYFNDDIKIAVKIKSNEEKEFLISYFSKINYFGKRGCFFQFIESNIIDSSSLPIYYSKYFNLENIDSIINGLLIEMDDFDTKVKFEEVNTFSNKKTKRDKKVFYFNYEQIKANKSFTLYKLTV